MLLIWAAYSRSLFMQFIHKEELANSITHGAGLVLSAAGLPVLIVLAALRGSAQEEGMNCNQGTYTFA